MKIKVAVAMNLVLVAVASFFVSTNSIFGHQPQPPEELLK
jgi:cyclic lactone autoinducer peptide